MRTKSTTRETSRPKATAAAKSSREKVQAYRQRMREKGLRLVQIWLPNTQAPEFIAEARRQSVLANRSPFAAEDQAWADSLTNWNTG